MQELYLLADCVHCDEETTYGPVVTMLEHHGAPAIPFDIGKHTEFVCSSCGGSSFTGEFDLTR